MDLTGAASRESLALATRGLDDFIDGADPDELARMADELFATVALLDREPTLRRALTDPAADPDRRSDLLARVLGDRVGDATTRLLRPLVRSRWSAPRDLPDAVEQLGHRAALGAAERRGTLDDVEDQLFRFGRILDAEPRLRQALEDQAADPDRRQTLLDRLVGDRVDPTTGRLLRQAVRAPRGRTVERSVTQLVELAAARRQRYVAVVTAAAPLTEQQETRLADLLARIYGRPVSVQVSVDPSTLGGLVVQVGDEIIDGSVLSRLNQVRRQLAG
ncbi:MAG TPA: F0F1 ATP synthase subunit delta [Actinoplanes sp.]|nr:F0F1 ATP synthase subunit delta [Actinoplanes sp.]